MRLTEFNGKDHAEAEKLTLLAAFADTQFYGDGMRIAPQADFADGKLDICRISPFESLLSCFACFRQCLSVGLVNPKVEYSRAERVRVQTETRSTSMLTASSYARRPPRSPLPWAPCE